MTASLGQQWQCHHNDGSVITTKALPAQQWQYHHNDITCHTIAAGQSHQFTDTAAARKATDNETSDMPYN